MTQWVQDPAADRERSGRQVRNAGCRRRSARDRQAHQRDPADSFRVGRRRDSTGRRGAAAQGARRCPPAPQRAPAPRRARGRSAALSELSLGSTPTTPASPASAPARWRSSCSAPCDLPPDAITYEWAGDTRPIAPNTSLEGRAKNRRVEVEVWYDEPKERVAQQEVLVPQDFKRIKVCRVETLCKLRFKEGQERRARVKNLVPPLHYEDETTEVSDEFVEHIRKALDNLQQQAERGGQVHRLHGGCAAHRPQRAHLRRPARAIRRRKAHARRARRAGSPQAAERRGGERRPRLEPTARYATTRPQGRALNRRIEVQFWHDDQLQELPDEPQLCPATDGAEVVTRVYDPPWGSIAPLELEKRTSDHSAGLHRTAASRDGRRRRQDQRTPALRRLHSQ